MAAKYRIVLRGRKGFSALRSATSFEIYYGKRRLLAKTLFPKRAKKASQKRAFLENLVEQIESKRLQILAKRRRKSQRLRHKKLKEELKKRTKQLERRRIRKSSEKQLSRKEEFLEGFNDAASMAYDDLPNFSKAEYAAPVVLESATIGDVLIVPHGRENEIYTKRVIDKDITYKNQTRAAHATILDFDLTDDYQVEVDRDNFEIALLELQKLMLAHMFLFFKETKDTSDAYILRFKISWTRGKEKTVTQGFSFERQEIANFSNLKGLFDETLRKLYGHIDPKTKRVIFRNYLEGNTELYVKGFTFEAFTDWESF